MRFSSLPFRRAVSGLTAATALALGATLVAAPSASAVGEHSSCTKNIRNKTLQVVQWDHADMYAKPSFSSTVKKSVFAGSNVTVYCTAKGGDWYYSKHGSTKGWMEYHAFF